MSLNVIQRSLRFVIWLSGLRSDSSAVFPQTPSALGRGSVALASQIGALPSPPVASRCLHWASVASFADFDFTDYVLAGFAYDVIFRGGRKTLLFGVYRWDNFI